jgi:hypothetical protein
MGISAGYLRFVQTLHRGPTMLEFLLVFAKGWILLIIIFIAIMAVLLLGSMINQE